MSYRVTFKDSGQEVFAFADVENFRGEAGIFLSVTRGPQPGKSAKVLVDVDSGRGDGSRMEVENYCHVWGLTVEEKSVE